MEWIDVAQGRDRWRVLVNGLGLKYVCSVRIGMTEDGEFEMVNISDRD